MKWASFIHVSIHLFFKSGFHQSKCSEMGSLSILSQKVQSLTFIFFAFLLKITILNLINSISNIALCAAPFSPQGLSFSSILLLWVLYFGSRGLSIPGDERITNLKQGAAFYCTCSLIGRSASQFHCKTNMIILLAFVIPTTLHYPHLLAGL